MVEDHLPTCAMRASEFTFEASVIEGIQGPGTLDRPNRGRIL